MLQKAYATPQFAMRCAFLFLIFAVFAWGLQAKLSLYHTAPGTCSTVNSMAKLSTENRGARSAAAVTADHTLRVTWESLYFAAFAFVLQGHQVTAAQAEQDEAGPRIPWRYYLHGPDLTLRPPPQLS